MFFLERMIGTLALLLVIVVISMLSEVPVYVFMAGIAFVFSVDLKITKFMENLIMQQVMKDMDSQAMLKALNIEEPEEKKDDSERQESEKTE